MAIVNGCNPFLVKGRWFESSLAQNPFDFRIAKDNLHKFLANVVELVYTVVLGAMTFGLQVRILSLVFLGNITQLVRVPALQAGSRRFDSDCFQISSYFILYNGSKPSN